MRTDERQEAILSEVFGSKSQMLSKNTLSDLTPNMGIIGIENVQKELADIRARSKDHTIRTGDISFQTKRKTFTQGDKQIGYDSLSLAGGELDSQLSDWGLGQACGMFGVPASYIKKCIVEDQGGLAVQNLNRWVNLANPDKTMFIRETENRIHGVLTDKYKVFDDDEFVDIIADSTDKTNTYAITNQIVSPDITKIRVVMADQFKIGDDDYSVGFDISNSRVGRSSVKVQLITFRWACDNGMIFAANGIEIFQRNHRSIDIVDRVAIKNMIDGLPDFTNKIKELAPLNSKRLASDELDHLLAKFKNVYKSDKCIDKIVETMTSKYDSTKLGFANAITEVAQEYNIFTRTVLEQHAGNVLLERSAS